MEMLKGKFIVLEGMSGSGKTFQHNRLAETDLRKSCFFGASPTKALFGTVVRSIYEGRAIDSSHLEQCRSFIKEQENDITKLDFWVKVFAILDALAHGDKPSQLDIQILFIADRIDFLVNVIGPALAKSHVILDRYMLSTFTYGGSGGILYETLKELHIEAFSSFPQVYEFWRPDVIIVYDVTVQTAIDRLKRSGKIIDIFEADVQRMHRIRSLYQDLSKKKWFGGKTVLINAERSANEVFSEVRQEILTAISENKSP
ncbi:MAG: hypothetical protein Q8R26_03565 [bacterium]|nr:hypothetical protein [bacterium]